MSTAIPPFVFAGEYRGRTGKDGSNVLPTDVAIADAINDPDSATLGALADAIAADSAPGTIGYVENITSVATIGTVTFPIPGTIVLVPASDRDVVLEWGCFLANTGSTFTGGTRGVLYCQVFELTGGVAVGITSTLTHHSLGINYVTASFAAQTGSFRVGPAGHDRLFALYGAAVTEAGTGVLSCAVRNIPTGRTFLRAVA